MNVETLKNQIEITLGMQIPFNEIKDALSRVINEVNLKCDKRMSMVTLTGDSTDVVISDDEEYAIDKDERIISGGRWIAGIEWDSDLVGIRLPSNYYKIWDVYSDGTQMLAKPYNEVTGSEETLYYCNEGGYLYFGYDVNADSVKIEARVQLYYPAYTGGEEYTGMPSSADIMLEDGVLYMLYSRAKYYRDGLLGLYRDRFQTALELFTREVQREDKPTSRTTRFTY